MVVSLVSANLGCGIELSKRTLQYFFHLKILKMKSRGDCSLCQPQPAKMAMTHNQGYHRQLHSLCTA